MKKDKKFFEYVRGLGYRIETDGRIIGSRGLVIRGSLNHDGYRYFAATHPEGRHHSPLKIMVHRMQAYQKYGDKIFEVGFVVRHKGDDKSNNSWDNILLGSQQENCLDVPRERRVAQARRAASFCRIFTDEDVARMRVMRHEKKMTYQAIAVEVGLSSVGHLHQVINGDGIYQNTEAT